MEVRDVGRGDEAGFVREALRYPACVRQRDADGGADGGCVDAGLCASDDHKMGLAGCGHHRRR